MHVSFTVSTVERADSRLSVGERVDHQFENASSKSLGLCSLLTEPGVPLYTLFALFQTAPDEWLLASSATIRPTLNPFALPKTPMASSRTLY